MTKEQLDQFKLATFKSFENSNLGDGVGWTSIVEKAGIPEQYRDELKHIFYHLGYMHKTSQAQGIGDLVRGDSSIVAEKYDLIEKGIQPIQITNFIGNTGRSIIHQSSVVESNISSIATTPKHTNETTTKSKIKFILLIIGGIAAILTITEIIFKWM